MGHASVEDYYRNNLKVERTRAIRDIGMSLAQASINSPFLPAALMVLAGCGLKGIAATMKKVPIPAGSALAQGGQWFNNTELCGNLLIGAAGIDAGITGAQNILGSIFGKGGPAPVSLAYDVPESERGYAAPAPSAGGGNPFSFQVPVAAPPPRPQG